MSTINNIQPNDKIQDSRAVINQNFENLNTDKVEDLTDLGLTKTASEYNDAVDNSPTTAQKAALAGNSGTPGAGNRYVTEEGLSPIPPVVRVYENSGSPHTWTKPAGLKYIIVEVQGAGGSGAGAQGGGTGGNAGAYAKKLILASALGSTETVTVGAASVGSGNTSFGSLVTAQNGANASGSSAPAAAATATGGDINISGGQGGYGGGPSGSGQNGASAGGDSMLGRGGFYRMSSTVDNTSYNGAAGVGYGAGGSGGRSASDGTPGASGGAGTQGVVIVTEFF